MKKKVKLDSWITSDQPILPEEPIFKELPMPVKIKQPDSPLNENIREIDYSETIITEEKEEVPFVLDPEEFIQNSIKNQNFVIYDTNKEQSPLRMSKQ